MPGVTVTPSIGEGRQVIGSSYYGRTITKSLQAGEAVQALSALPARNKTLGKKVRGKLFNFGPWEKPKEALERWLAEKDDLLAGCIPRSRKASAAPTLRDLCNQ
jgi:GH24 family phage-related lysozyme (muramidase)